MPMERGGNHRRGSMPRPHPPVGKYPAKDKREQLHGVSEREKQPDDIPKVWKYEVCIQESRILVQRILCRYDGEKYKGNTGIYPESIKNRSGE